MRWPELIAGGHPHAIKPGSIAGCTYCYHAGRFGRDDRAESEKTPVTRSRSAISPSSATASRPIALGEAEGMVKTVFDAKTGELLGAHMIGAEVTRTDPRATSSVAS